MPLRFPAYRGLRARLEDRCCKGSINPFAPGRTLRDVVGFHNLLVAAHRPAESDAPALPRGRSCAHSSGGSEPSRPHPFSRTPANEKGGPSLTTRWRLMPSIPPLTSSESLCSNPGRGQKATDQRWRRACPSGTPDVVTLVARTVLLHRFFLDQVCHHSFHQIYLGT